MSGKNTHKHKRTHGLILFALVMISILSSFVLSQEFNGGAQPPQSFSELPPLPDFDDPNTGFLEPPEHFEPAIPFPGYGFNDESSNFQMSTVSPEIDDFNPLTSEKSLFHPYSQDNRATQVSYQYPSQLPGDTAVNNDYSHVIYNAPYNPPAYNTDSSQNQTQPLTVPNFEQHTAGEQVFPPTFPDDRISQIAPPDLSATKVDVALPPNQLPGNTPYSAPYNAPLPQSAPLPAYGAPPPYIPGQMNSGHHQSGPAPADNSQSLNMQNSPGTPSTFEGDDPSQIVIDVRVVGYGQIPLEKLRQKVKTRPNRPYNELQVEEDKRALMQTGWFHNVHPSIYKTQDGITITFELIERPLLHYVKFVGNKTYPKSKLQEISMISPGDPLDPMYVYQAKSRIEDFYRESGHHKINVEILSGDRSTDRGAVFLVSEGRKQRIDRVTFVGCNTVISGARLKTQIQSKPGILYLIGGEFTRAQLDRDVEALTAYYRNLGYFFAKIDRDFSEGRGYMGFGKEDTWVSVRFIVDEGPRCKISKMTINGNRVFTDQQIFAELKKTKVGEYFNRGGLEMDVRRIKEMYGKKGRPFTEVIFDYVVDAPNPNEGIIELVFSVRESRISQFGEVTVDILDVNGGSAPYTKTATVLNRTPRIRAGKLVDTGEISKAERRLRYSSIFNSNPAQGYVPELIFELDESMAEKVFEDYATASEDSGTIRGQYVPGRIARPDDANTKSTPQNPVPRGNMKPGTENTVDAMRAKIKREVKDMDSQIQRSTERDEKILREKQLQKKPGSAGFQPASGAPGSVGVSPASGRQDACEPRPMLILGQSRSVPSMPSTTTNSAYAGSASVSFPMNGSGDATGSYTDPNGATYSTNSTPSVQPFVVPQDYDGRYGSVSSVNAFSNGQETQYETAQYSASPYDAPQYETTQYETTQYGSTRYDTQDAPQPSAKILPFNSNPNSSNPAPTDYSGYGNSGTNNSGIGFLAPPQPYIPGARNPSTQGGGIIDPVMPGSAGLQDYNNLLFNSKPQPIITVPAKFRVQETQTGQFRASVGVNSDAGLIANFLYKEDNFDWRRPPKNPFRFEDWRNAFRGAGEQFKIDLSPGTDTQRYEVAWGNPHFMNTDWSLSMSGFYYSRYYTEWDERRIGGTAALGYRLTEDLMLSLSYKGESVRIYDPVIRGVPDLEKALGTSGMHTFGLRLAHDTRDNQHLATEGHLVTFSAEQVVGSFNFPRLGYDARQYFMLRERPDTSGRWVLGFRSAATWSDNDTPIFERFYAGGFTTLRGFDYRGVSPRFADWLPIGGNFEFYNSAELLFPITADDMIRGVVFVDTGCVQPKINDWAQKYRVAPGFGVRISIPFMGPTPIAFDFAFPVCKDPTDQKNVFTFYVGFMR